MHGVVRYLFAFALVPAMVQSGMMQWTPRVHADVTLGNATSLEYYGPKQGHAHQVLPEASANVMPENAHGERCDRPNIDCDCTDCLSYFHAHTLTLPAIVVALLKIPPPAAHEYSVIVLAAGMNIAPPIPPPRS
jgi:hypothetical protein